MVIFTKSYLSGLNRDQSNTWDNIFLNWLENNWTLSTVPKYDPVTAKHGVLFGNDYYGQWDFVASAKISENVGIENKGLSIGGRHDQDTIDISFSFSVRKYSGQQGDEIPQEVTFVMDFVENLIDTHAKDLQNEGIRYMKLIDQRDGEIEMYGQQIYEMRFIIRCLVSRINLTD